MQVHWCALSGGRGRRGDRPSSVENATTHCVGSNDSRLVACFTRCTCAAGVSYLHFETVGPTVPFPVPGRFDGGPMGWLSAFSGRPARECGRAWRGSLIGHHRGESTLNVLDGLGEGGVCCDEVVNGGVLLDGRIGEVVHAVLSR